MSQKALDILLSSHKLGTKINKLKFCNDCTNVKQVKSSYCTCSLSKIPPLTLCFMYNSTKSSRGSLNFITFIDDYSKKCWVYLVEDKTKVFANFRKMHAYITTQTCLKTETRKCQVYLVEDKTMVFDAFRNFHAYITTQNTSEAETRKCWVYLVKD